MDLLGCLGFMGISIEFWPLLCETAPNQYFLNLFEIKVKIISTHPIFSHAGWNITELGQIILGIFSVEKTEIVKKHPFLVEKIELIYAGSKKIEKKTGSRSKQQILVEKRET